MKKATKEDLAMLKYFWESHQNIERYSSFNDIESDLKKNYPHILEAWTKFKCAIVTMEVLIKNIEDDIQH